MPSISQSFNNSARIQTWLSGRRLAFLFFVAACLVYGPLYNAGFVTDFLGWLECRETTPFWHAYTCFGNRGLYFIPFIVLEFLTSTFWLHPLPWFLVWTGLHALNAYLVADVANRLFDAFKVRLSPFAPIVAGLIFLLHPWQVEVVAWKACVNYLFACLWMLLILRYYLKGQATGSRKYYWIGVGLYLPFLFTLEFAVVFPLILALLMWALRVEKSVKQRLVATANDIAPFIAGLGAWLLVNKALLGIWIGHYGASTHLAVQPLGMSSAILKYLMKIFAFSRFLPFQAQTDLYQIPDSTVAGILVLGSLIVMALFYNLFSARMSSAQRLKLFLFLSGVICIVPVTNLYFYYLQYSENDRYTYLAISCFAILLPALLWQWKKWLGKVLLALYILGSLIGTTRLVHIWEKSTIAHWQHIRTFPVPQASKIFLLNVPDNYKGTFMFRNIGGDSAFEEVWRYIDRSVYSGKMYDVFQYNMTDLGNDFIVTWESENKLKVEFAQWGNWWWRNGVGGEQYSNEEYTAWPEGKYYYMEFKKPMEDALILYYTPAGWKKVDQEAGRLR